MEKLRTGQITISMVIVNWNTRDLLIECVDSIMADRKSSHYEIIVVDNGSTDGSYEAFRERFPRVIFIRNETNLGFAKAVNIGIKRTTGRYVCLVNTDVIVRKDCITLMSDFMDRHPSVGILGPKLLNSDLTLQPSCRNFPGLWNSICMIFGLHKLFPGVPFFMGEHLLYFPHDSIRRVDALTGAFLMTRREALDKVGLLDEDFFIYGEETDWCKRFWEAGWEVVFYPDGEVIHLGGGSSSKEPVRFYRELYRSKLNFWKKHYSMPSRIAFKCIIFLYQMVRIIHGGFWYALKPSTRDDVKQKLRGNIQVLSHLLLLGARK